MFSTRAIATAAASLLAVVVVGCGVGEGDADEGTATLTVTRDYGQEPVLEASLDDPASSQTVVRFLDREAEIETSYGGNFVDAIDGTAGRIKDGRTEDWFFYVNGYWSPIGAGEAKVRAGDRIWWDYRDWTDAYRVSAVVGSWPEPFVNGRGDVRPGTELVCRDVETACDIAEERLQDAGAEVERLAPGAERGDADEVLTVLVGTWGDLRGDPVAAQLEEGPATSGVYGRPVRCDGAWFLEALNDRAKAVGPPTSAGWIAALSAGEEHPTWIVSGTDEDAVRSAAESLRTEALKDRYAVAVIDGEAGPLPAATEAPAAESGSSCP